MGTSTGQQPGPPPVPALLNDLQQVASFPCSPVSPLQLQLEVLHPTLTGSAAATGDRLARGRGCQ